MLHEFMDEDIKCDEVPAEVGRKEDGKTETSTAELVGRTTNDTLLVHPDCHVDNIVSMDKSFVESDVDHMNAHTLALCDSYERSNAKSSFVYNSGYHESKLNLDIRSYESVPFGVTQSNAQSNDCIPILDDECCDEKAIEERIDANKLAEILDSTYDDTVFGMFKSDTISFTPKRLKVSRARSLVRNSIMKLQNNLIECHLCKITKCYGRCFLRKVMRGDFTTESVHRFCAHVMKVTLDKVKTVHTYVDEERHKFKFLPVALINTICRAMNVGRLVIGQIIDLLYLVDHALSQVCSNILAVVKNEFLRSLVSTIVYFVQLCKATSMAEYTLITTQFTLVMLGSLPTCLEDVIVHAASAFQALFVNVKSETMADNVDVIRRVWDRLIGGEFFTMVRTFILTLISFKWFNRDFSRYIIKFLGAPKRYMPITEVISLMLKGIKSLLLFGEKVMSGAPLSELILADDPVCATIDEINELLSYKDMLYTGLPVKGRMCSREFRKRADEVLQVAEGFLKDMSPYDSNRPQLKFLYQEMRNTLTTIESWRKSSERVPPVAVVLHGHAGIGKSKILQVFARVWSLIKEREFDMSHIYSRDKTSEYWEGYVSASHPFVHYSEVGNEHVNQVRMKGDAVLKELNSLIDSLPFSCNMAFEGKGKTFADPEMVLIDTNNKTMHIDTLMHCKAAMYRRFLFVHVEVKPEFRKPNSTALDVDVSLQAGGDLLDRYNFVVSSYYPVRDDAQEKQLMRGDIYQLTEFLFEYFRIELEKQQAVNDANLYDFIKRDFLNDDVKENQEIDVRAESEFVGDLQEFEQNCYDKCIYLVSEFPKFAGMITYDLFILLLLCSLQFFLLASKSKYTMMSNIFLSVLCYFLRYAWINNILLFIMIVGLFTKERYESLIVRYTKDKLKVKISYFFQHVKYMLKLENFKPFGNSEVERVYVPILGILASSILAYVGFNKFRRNDEYRSEATTTFYKDTDHEVNNALNLVEELSGADVARKRVKVKDNHWNQVYHPLGKAVYCNDSLSLSQYVSRNIRKVKVQSPNGFLKTHILGIQGSYAVINTHAFDKTMKSFDIFISSNGFFDDETSYTKLHIDSITRFDMGNDVSLIDTGKLQFKDILKHVLDGRSPTMSSGALLQRKLTVTRMQSDLVHNDPAFYEDKLYVPYVYKTKHEVGLCGLPLLLDIIHGKSALVGIHAAGSVNDDRSFAVPLDRQKIKSAITVLDHKSPLLGIVSQGCLDMEMELPVSKSPLRYEYLPHLSLFGKVLGNVMLQSKSFMKRNCVDGYEKFLSNMFGFERTVHYIPPKMRPFTRDGKYYSPYNIALRKMNNDPKVLDLEILRKVIRVYTDRIIKGLEDRGITSMSPYTFEEAVNGARHDSYLRRINATTSGGFGYPGSKEKYLPIVLEEESYVNREMTLDLKLRIIEIVRAYERGESVRFVFLASLKDEPRDRVKVLIGKTRVFYMSPVDLLVLSRVYLGQLYTSMVAYGDVFCTSVGIDMFRDAHDFVTELTSFSPDIIEGDYGGFDVSNPVYIARAANTVIYNVLEHFGYNDHALLMVKGILTDLLFPHVSMNKDIFCKPGMQPSGKYGTAEDNSLRGVILLMYAWYSNDELSNLNFFDYVKPRTYGDDVLAAVKPEVGHMFNNLTYQRFVREEYGMDFTSASKSQDMERFMDVNTMSFLKRTFVKRKDNDRWIAKLDLNSIYKMLEWTIPSKSITRMEQLVATAQSAAWELFLHCDDMDQYIGCCEELRRIVRLNFDRADVSLPAYDEIYNSVFPPIIQAETQSSFLVSYDTYHVSLLQEVQEIEAKLDRSHEFLNCALASGLNFRFVRRWQLQPEEVSLLRRYYDILATIRKIEMQHMRLELRAESEASGMLKEPEPDIEEKTENFVDMGGDETEVVSTGINMVLDIGQREVLEMKSFLEREVEIDDFDVTVGSTPAFDYDIWNIVTIHPTIRAKLRNYAYLHADIVIRITMSGSPFHYGKFLISYQPYANINENIIQHKANLAVDTGVYPLFVNYLSQAPGACVMDVRENKPLEMICPYIGTKPMFRLFNESSTVISSVTPYDDVINAGNLFVYAINPVLSIGTAPTSVNVRIIAHLTNVQLGCSTATQVDVVAESMTTNTLRDERKVGVVEKVASQMATVSSYLSTIPQIRPIAKASQLVFSGLEQMASVFGWSRPSIIEKPVFVKNRPFASSVNMIGDETIERLVYDPCQEITVDPRVCARDEDDMAISTIASRESFLTSFSWETTDTPLGPPIWQSKVTPNLATVFFQDPSYVIQPTALSFSAAPFKYWRGKIDFRFEIVCSAYHRGKLAFYFEPNLYQYTLISASLSLNKNFLHIIDIQEIQDTVITVDWAYQRAWANVQSPEEVVLNYGDLFDASADPETSNGYIAVVPYTTIQSPDGSPIYVNVYVSSHEIQYNQIFSDNMPDERIMISAEAAYTTTLRDEVKDVTVINSVSGSAALTSTYHFGEQPLSFRTMLKRYVSTFSANFTLGNDYSSVGYRRPIYKVPYPAYGETVTRETTLIEYLPYAFLGMRGSIRQRDRILTPSFSDALGYTVASLFSSSITSTSTTDFDPAPTVQIGSVQFVQATNGGIEFEIPFYTNNLFVFAFADNFESALDMTTDYTRSYRIAKDVFVTSGDTVYFEETTSIGEDFSFMRYMGAPMYSIS